ncbi:MAG: phosphatidylserine decarboxylase family protein [Gemmatimonadaceae bacterium]|nr:phosphatidylserine decarboxylase family protein [Gemmatimonadaceae bacterium]
MAREGYPFLAVAAVLAALCWWVAQTQPILAAAAVLFTILAGFMVFFFRDPGRRPPDAAGAVVSAADGRVVAIEPLDGADEYVGDAATRISVFLSVFNVHINRIPLAGEIDVVERRSGRYKVAFAEDASEQNEQSVIGIRQGDTRLVVKQIVGILARRITCNLQPGQQVDLGERFGLIRFGSRVDLIVPNHVEIRVSVGDRVRAGETVMGVIQ